MRHNTPDTIKRAERFQIILIGEGILVGAIAGLIYFCTGSAWNMRENG